MANEVLYYGYASNLLAERFSLIVEKPVLHCCAKYKDHTLGFGPFSESWGGNMVMAVPCPGKYLWGAVWKLTAEQWENLKKQEAVDKGVFMSKEVSLEKADGSTIAAHLIYREAGPEKDGLASVAYRDVIVKGAEQLRLPGDYIQTLREIPVNDNKQQLDFVNIKTNF